MNEYFLCSTIYNFQLAIRYTICHVDVDVKRISELFLLTLNNNKSVYNNLSGTIADIKVVSTV